LRGFSYIFGFLFWIHTIQNTVSQSNIPIKLSDKLTQLEEKFKVSFSYNHSFFDSILLENDFDCESISVCLEMIQEQVPISFKNNNGNNYMLIPKRATISFKVIDNETNENISALEYQINAKSRQGIIAENGVFTLENVFPLDSITLHSYFYKPVTLLAKDLQENQNIVLKNRQFSLNEVVLSGYLTKGIKSKVSDHSLQINTESLGLLAGETDGDIFNVLNNIPGVHTPSGKAGNLNFRGNTYDQNLVQIDDIPIYHSGHFLGAISPYNTSIITNVEVQRNMLPVKWGGRVGGLINMTTYDEIPDSTSYEVLANTLFAGATIKSKLIEDKLSLLVTFRSSYPGFRSPKLEAISTLIFQGSRLESIADEINNADNFDFGFVDMNAKLNYKINDKHSTTLSFINIQNNLSAEIKSDNTNETDFRELELDNWGITAKWKANFSEKLATEFRFSKSTMNLNSISEGFILTERSSLEKYDNTISDTRFITEAVYNFNPDLTLEAGYTLTNHELSSDEIEQENSIDSKRAQKGIVHSSYASLEKNWNNNLTMNIGFHNNYYAPLKKFYVNPRFLLNYAFDKHFYLKSSFGTSNQFIQKKFTNDFDDFNITNQLWYLPNDEITPLKATQTMIGGIFNKSKWLIDIELYRKKTNYLTNKTDDSQGSLASLGTNVFVKKKWKNLETWISYALANTKTDFNEVSTDAFFDQRHIINFTNLVNINRWKFAVTWGYFSGMPVIYSDETDIDTLQVIFDDNFDAMHQLDFSSSYTFYNSSKSFKTVIGLSILNVYNQDNIVNIFQNTSESTFRKASQFAPNLQVNLYF